MSNPILIDPVAYARAGQCREGRLAIAELDPRVHEVLANRQGNVSWRLEGFADRLRRPSLRLVLDTTVDVTCQRCLEPMTLLLQGDSVVTLFFSTEALEAATETDETLDAILAEPELDVKALIEDEIIMGLPLSPRHETCDNAALARAKADKPNPFAVLAQLKSGKTE